jgi:hypothetical protein
VTTDVHDPASHAGSDDRPGVPDLHGKVPSLRRWEATRQRYFTINWIQLATTWAAFALFLVALVTL